MTDVIGGTAPSADPLVEEPPRRAFGPLSEGVADGYARIKPLLARVQAGMFWPIFVYLVVRGLSWLVYTPLINTINCGTQQHPRECSPIGGLRWLDGGNYVLLARQGYVAFPIPGHPITGHPQFPYTTTAFFPLYSLLLRWTHSATGLDMAHIGLVISFFASLAAVLGIHRITERIAGRRAATITVALWAILPSALYQWALYADILFIALAVWSLDALLCRRWVLAGALCALTGFTRPQSVVLIATVGIAALVAVIRRQDGWRPWVAGVLAPSGLAAFMLWLYHDYHRWDAYLHAQKMWGDGFDFGKTTANLFWQISQYGVIQADIPIVAAAMVGVLIMAIVLVAERELPWQLILFSVLGVVMCLGAYGYITTKPMPWQLILFSVLGVVMCLGAYGYITTKPRELMPFFPLLIPVAVALSKVRTRSLVIAVGLLALFCGWYGWYIPLRTLTGPP